MQTIAALHPLEMKNIKIIYSGQHDQGEAYAFIVEFVSGGKKYREIFSIDKLSLETTEVMFTELLEISLTQSHQLTLINTYQTLSTKEYASNKYFGLVNQFNLNQNQLLKGAKILAVGYKPQNLGFTYKIDYLTIEANIYEI